MVSFYVYDFASQLYWLNLLVDHTTANYSFSIWVYRVSVSVKNLNAKAMGGPLCIITALRPVSLALHWIVTSKLIRLLRSTAWRCQIMLSGVAVASTIWLPCLLIFSRVLSCQTIGACNWPSKGIVLWCHLVGAFQKWLLLWTGQLSGPLGLEDVPCIALQLELVWILFCLAWGSTDSISAGMHVHSF